MKREYRYYQLRGLGFSIVWSHLGMTITRLPDGRWGVGVIRVAPWRWSITWVRNLAKWPNARMGAWPRWKDRA